MRSINSVSNLEIIKKEAASNSKIQKYVDVSKYTKGMKKIGTGYNADVYCCTEDSKILKIGDKVSLIVEYAVYKDLLTIGFPVLEMVLDEDIFLEKPYVDPNFFADKLLKKGLTHQQEAGLDSLWKLAIKYTMISGVPLDLKADNLWWNSEEDKWLLVDTGPKLDDDDDNKFEFTLDLANGQSFIKKLKGERDVEEWSFIFSRDSKGEIVEIDSVPFSLGPLPKGTIDYDAALQNLHMKALKIIQKETDNDLKLFFLRFVDMNKEVSDIIKGDIKFGEKSCSVLSECNYEEKLLKTQINTVLKLKKDTEKYYNTLYKDDLYAIQAYTGSKYAKMNKCLRTGDVNFNCTEDIKDIIIKLEKVLKSKEAPKLENDITVYRGIDNETSEEARNVSLALDKLEPGDLWEDRGFVSTSSQHPPKMFLGRTCCIFEIFLKAGTPAFYIGEKSNVSHEEEIILLPGILLRYIGKRTGDKGILYKNNRIDTYMFECEGCNVGNRYVITPSPFEGRKPLFPYQPQDRKVGKDRLDLFHLTEIYNKYIPPKNKKIVRLMTWNVHEWRNRNNKNKREEITYAINNVSPDILALQESTGGQITNSFCIADNGSHGEKLRNEIVVKKGMNVFLDSSVSLGYDRCMIISGVELPDNSKILIGNLHLDVSSSKRRLENIQKAVEGMETISLKTGIKDIIICGDFNSYRRKDYGDEAYSDLKKLKENYGEGMDIFESIDYLEKLGYKETFDMMKVLNPINTNIYGGRIDFIFVSKEFSKKSSGVYAYYSSLSDHVSIILDLILNNGETQEGKILNDLEYKNEPPKVVPSKVVPSKVEPPKVEPPKVEPPKVEPPKVEPPKVEPPKVEPPKVVPSKVEPSKPEPPKAPLKVEPLKSEKLISEKALEELSKKFTAERIIKIASKKRGYELAELAIPKAMEEDGNLTLKYLYSIIGKRSARNGDFSYAFSLIPKGADPQEILFGLIKNGNIAVTEKFIDNYKLQISSDAEKISCRSDNQKMKHLLFSLLKANNEKYMSGSCMFGAARKSDKTIISSLIGPLGFTKELVRNGLLGASRGGHKDVVEYFIRHYKENDWNSFLTMASRSGNMDLVNFFIEKGADDFLKAAETAAYGGNNIILQNLIDRMYREDVYTIERQDKILEAARSGGYREIMDLVKKSKSKHKSYLLGENARRGNLKNVKYLISEGANVSHNGNLAIKRAAENGHLEVVKYLIQNGADIHASDDHALRWASREGHLEVVKYLIQNGADIHASDDKALRWASEKGHLEVVKYLVQNGADIHASDDHALRWASREGHLEIVKYLIQNKANIHADGDEALRWASEKGHLEVVKYLVQNGADIHAKNDEV